MGIVDAGLTGKGHFFSGGDEWVRWGDFLCDVLGRFPWSSQAGGISQMSPSSPQHVGQEGDVAGLLACGGEGDLP